MISRRILCVRVSFIHCGEVGSNSHSLSQLLSVTYCAVLSSCEEVLPDCAEFPNDSIIRFYTGQHRKRGKTRSLRGSEFSGFLAEMSICYKCNESGHFARECPAKEDGGGGGGAGGRNDSKKCYKCNRFGHFARECADVDRCYRCDEAGHISRDCSKPFVHGICYSCNKPGHAARHCRKFGILETTTCYSCGETGHLSRNCKLRAQKCYACGKMGHISSDCPSPDVDGKKCYLCQASDHISKDCPSNVNSSDQGTVSALVICYRCKKNGHYAKDCDETDIFDKLV